MILTCPQCATRYQMEDEKFPAGGRNVRCAKCGHLWFEEGPVAAPEPALDSLSQPEPPPPPPSAEPQSPPPTPEEFPQAAFTPPPPSPPPKAQPEIPPQNNARERTLLVGGWIALAAVVALIIWGGISYRDTIASIWPQSSTVYAALGVPVNARALTFTDVAYRRDMDSGKLVLTVEGNLVNVSSREIEVPSIEITLTDSGRRKIDGWTFSPATARLKPGERLAFETRRTNPPEGARHLEMKLAQAGG